MIDEVVVRISGQRVDMRVGRAASTSVKLLRNTRLVANSCAASEHALSTERGRERIDRELVQVVAVRRVDIEDRLGGVSQPALTAPESIVSRCGWYHAVPSSPISPVPWKMSATRWIGVISPAGSQARGSPSAASRPACTCAAARFGGEVSVSSA